MTRPFRLLHVVPSYLPAYRYGGPIRSVHGLCRGLAERGHHVEVFTTTMDGEQDLDVPRGRPVPVEDVLVSYFGPVWPRRLFRAPSLGRALRQRVQEFDVVHLHSVFLWPTYAAARIASRELVPYIVCPRGMLVERLVREKSRWAKRAWIEAVERRTIEAAASVHFTTELEREDMAPFGFRIPRSFVLPNGLEEQERQALVRAGSECARGDGPLLYLGRINWKKGLDRLLHALVDVPERRLMIAGNDEEGYQPQLEQLARVLGLSERVDFVGEVRGQRKLEILGGAAALVLPSTSENFGNVVIEAMAAGRPVLVTRGVGMARVVEESGAGVVTEADPGSIARGLNRLLADAPERRRQGEQGQQVVAERFTWGGIAESMEGVYEQLLGKTDETRLRSPSA